MDDKKKGNNLNSKDLAVANTDSDSITYPSRRQESMPIWAIDCRSGRGEVVAYLR